MNVNRNVNANVNSNDRESRDGRAFPVERAPRLVDSREINIHLRSDLIDSGVGGRGDGGDGGVGGGGDVGGDANGEDAADDDGDDDGPNRRAKRGNSRLANSCNSFPRC